MLSVARLHDVDDRTINECGAVDEIRTAGKTLPNVALSTTKTSSHEIVD
jgi:hypothetical protein